MKIQKRLNPEFEEVEVELPIYRKGSGVKCHYWKVYSDEKTLHVCCSTDYPNIEIYHSIHAVRDNSIECTKEEFETEYNAVLTILNSKL